MSKRKQVWARRLIFMDTSGGKRGNYTRGGLRTSQLNPCFKGMSREFKPFPQKVSPVNVPLMIALSELSGEGVGLLYSTSPLKSSTQCHHSGRPATLGRPVCAETLFGNEQPCSYRERHPNWPRCLQDETESLFCPLVHDTFTRSRKSRRKDESRSDLLR